MEFNNLPFYQIWVFMSIFLSQIDLDYPASFLQKRQYSKLTTCDKIPVSTILQKSSQIFSEWLNDLTELMQERGVKHFLVKHDLGPL